MPNVATQQVIEPAKINVKETETEDADGILLTAEHNTLLTADHILTAHRMIEQYLGKPRPLSKVTATYTITDSSAPLTAVANYPVNTVISVLDATNAPIANVSNDDRYFWVVGGSWPATVVVQYYGGIEQQVYDAIFRQANVLVDRDDGSPERVAEDIGGALKWNYDPKFRSGLASDVKQMIFPFRVIGF